MIITYHNYKGGINNLVVIHEKIGKYGAWEGITARSTISEEHAIRNFKRKLKNKIA